MKGIRQAELDEELNPQVYVRSVARAVSILEQFTLDSPSLGLTEISGRLGLSKSTTHRLLSTLERLEMVELDPQTSRYRLGLKVFRMGSVVLQGMELVTQAESILDRLTEETDETSFLVVPDGNKALCVSRVDGRFGVRVLFLETGRRLAYNCGAAPRVLLAHMPPDRWEQIVANHVNQMTANSLMTREELLSDAEFVRTHGYAISREDVTMHACALGAPVLDYSGQVVGSVSLAGIVQRFSDEQLPFLIERTVKAGEELSRRLGYQPN